MISVSPIHMKYTKTKQNNGKNPEVSRGICSCFLEKYFGSNSVDQKNNNSHSLFFLLKFFPFFLWDILRVEEEVLRQQHHSGIW